MNTGRIFFIILLVMVGVGVGGYFLIKGDIFPVAVVNSEVITNKTFERHIAALSQYYEVSKKNAEANSSAVPQLPNVSDLQRATLYQLIEDALIASNFYSIVTDGDAAITRKLADAEKEMRTTKFQDSLRALYGLTVDEFRRFVLVPQAERELITDALREKGQEFDAWLASVQSNANVFILLRGFSWEKGELKAAK